MSHWETYYHLVWATRNREPLIDAKRATIIERCIRSICEEDGIVVHAIGMMPDHIHVAASIPPRLAVAAVVKRFKGSSSHLLNGPEATNESFRWQAQYGVLTFGGRSLSDVVAYVQNQATHHAEDRTRPTYETTELAKPAPVLSPEGTS